MTPQKFASMTMGKRYDMDGAYGAQCWDYFRYFLYYFNIPVDSYCAITQYVCDLWALRDQYGYYNFFDYITDPGELKNGDWIIWPRKEGTSHPASHIAMYLNRHEVGQNQPHPYVTEEVTSFYDMLGAFRPRIWTEGKKGYAEFFSQDFAHVYACGYPLHLRAGGDISFDSLTVMPKGERVQCYGYYHKDDRGRIWLYVTYKNITGFACMDYLYKVY